MCILIGFQAVSRLNINLVKSNVVKMGSKRDSNGLVRVLGSRIVSLESNVWGDPLELVSLRNLIDWVIGDMRNY